MAAAAAQIPSPTEAGPLAEAAEAAAEAGPLAAAAAVEAAAATQIPSPTADQLAEAGLPAEAAAAVPVLAGWPAGSWRYDKGSE